MIVDVMDESAQYQVRVPEKSRGNKALLIIIAVIILVGAVLLSYYFYNQYKKTQSLLSNQTALSSTETKGLIDAVGKLMVLPTGEQPTVATVSDASKLPNQPFFAKAENGDKVLIYSQSKKAILYRPSINKIIDVAPISIAQPTLEPTQATVSATVTVTPVAPTTVKPAVSPPAAVTPTIAPGQ